MPTQKKPARAPASKEVTKRSGGGIEEKLDATRIFTSELLVLYPQGLESDGVDDVRVVNAVCLEHNTKNLELPYSVTSIMRDGTFEWRREFKYLEAALQEVAEHVRAERLRVNVTFDIEP